MVQQVLQSIDKKKIQKLTNTYLTLNLQEIKTRVPGVAKNVEKVLFNMIESGELNAKVDKKENMVAFIEDDESENSDQFKSILVELEQQSL